MKTKQRFNFHLALAFALAMGALTSATVVKAHHGPAPVSDIDYVGMGSYSGNYTHSHSDHVWIVFNANAGDTVKFAITTGFAHHYYIYKAKNGCVVPGNSTAHPVPINGNGCL